MSSPGEIDILEHLGHQPSQVFGTDDNSFYSARAQPTLMHGEDYAVTIHDLAGRRIRDLEAGRGGVGERNVSWDGRTEAGTRAAPGVYMIRLRRGNGTEVRKIVMQR